MVILQKAAIKIVTSCSFVLEYMKSLLVSKRSQHMQEILFVHCHFGTLEGSI